MMGVRAETATSSQWMPANHQVRTQIDKEIEELDERKRQLRWALQV